MSVQKIKKANGVSNFSSLKILITVTGVKDETTTTTTTNDIYVSDVPHHSCTLFFHFYLSIRRNRMDLKRVSLKNYLTWK